MSGARAGGAPKVAAKGNNRRTLHSAPARSWSQLAQERETDQHKVSKRRKQVEFGYNTAGYQRYTQLVPKEQRRRGDPVTPDASWAWSKRGWTAAVQGWRVLLHKYDPPKQGGLLDATESLSRLRAATVSSMPPDWTAEAAHCRQALAAAATAAGGAAPPHDMYKGVRPGQVAEEDATLLALPPSPTAARSAVLGALRRGMKRRRQGGSSEAGGSAPKAPRPA